MQAAVGSHLKNKEFGKTLNIHKQLFPIIPRPDQSNLITPANVDTVIKRIKRFAATKLFGLTSYPSVKGKDDSGQKQETHPSTT